MFVHLDAAPMHEDFVVTGIGGPRAFRRRLMELGLLPGTVVRKTKVAPLGDPIQLRVRGTHLSIRRAEARGIEIQRAAASAA